MHPSRRAVAEHVKRLVQPSRDLTLHQQEQKRGPAGREQPVLPAARVEPRGQRQEGRQSEGEDVEVQEESLGNGEGGGGGGLSSGGERGEGPVEELERFDWEGGNEDGEDGCNPCEAEEIHEP